MADIVLINPRFEVSYWGLEHALPLLGKRANMPVACLPLLAALTPPEHTVTLIDENVEAIDFDRCARADIVGVTGMSVQRLRMREILDRAEAARASSPWSAAPGSRSRRTTSTAWPTSSSSARPRRPGRGSSREWEQGRHQRRYEQAEKTDMTTVPTPRFDLLKMRHYAFGSVQFSRGCPFQCEFCDIIVTFGRRPRIKTTGAGHRRARGAPRPGDADRLHRRRQPDRQQEGDQGRSSATLIAWQERHGYPLTFFTEASIDLADDPELMRLMVEANIVSVFIGIESPNEASLRETKKFQNVRAGGHPAREGPPRSRTPGMEVWCGMIVGFDNDDDDDLRRPASSSSHEARIVSAMIGMLSAIPKTPLYDRLAARGPARPGRRAASSAPTSSRCGSAARSCATATARVMAELYAPEAYSGSPGQPLPRGRLRHRPGAPAAAALAAPRRRRGAARPGDAGAGPPAAAGAGAGPAPGVRAALLAGRPGAPRPVPAPGLRGAVRHAPPLPPPGPGPRQRPGRQLDLTRPHGPSLTTP